MKNILLLSSAALLFAGCAASSSNSNAKEGRTIEKKIIAIGAYKATLGDLIKKDLEGRCNENKFIIETRKEGKVHTIVDIVMNETCASVQGQRTSCSCEYTGIGVTYNEISSSKEAYEWSNSIANSQTSNINLTSESNSNEDNNILYEQKHR